MKRFLTITILTLSCLCGCVFAGELRRDTKEETAVCLIESFGWSVDKQGSTELRRMSAHDFYAWYHHWIGKSGFRTNEIVSQAAHFYDNEILGYQAQSYRGKSSKKEWWYVAASKNCPDTGRRGPSTISLKNLC